MQSKEEDLKVEYIDGFYEEERNDFYNFRWIGKEGRIKIDKLNGNGYLQFSCFSNFRDLTHELKVFYAKLLPQWQFLTFELDSREEIDLKLETNKIFPKFYYPDNGRTLSIRVGNFKMHKIYAASEKIYSRLRNDQFSKVYENLRKLKNIKKNVEEKIPDEANLCSIAYPIYKEPWENYYILRRGILPCFYGDIPIAKMDSFLI